MPYRLLTPADNTRGPQYLAAVLDGFHEANRDRRRLVLELAYPRGEAGLYCRCEESVRTTFVESLADAYPESTLAEESEEGTRDASVWSAPVRLAPDCFPIRTFAAYEDRLNRNLADPLAGVLAALRATAGEDGASRIAITLRPARERHRRQAERTARRLARRFPSATIRTWCAVCATSPHPATRLTGAVLSLAGRGEPDPLLLAHAREKLAAHLFEAHVAVQRAGADRGAAVRQQLANLAGSLGQFTDSRAVFRLGRIRRTPMHPRGRGFLLTSAEAATLWHPPVATVRAARMPTTPFRELEPPLRLRPLRDVPHAACLGQLCFRDRTEPFGIDLDDRRRHLAVIGKTGMGKSTLLERMIVTDIQAGRGVALIDPHGDLADTVINHIPRRRTNDLVLFDAGDRAFPLAFNPLDCRRPEDRPLVASGVLAAFKKLYGESWGPRMEYIWRHALLAVLDAGGATLASVHHLLSDAAYRRRLALLVRDPVVRGFWQDEFPRWKPQLQAEAVAPIQNKLGQFLAHPILRAILDQPRSTLDLREAMDAGRILIVNLSKGRIGEDGSTLLGALLVSSLQLAAMSRADIPEGERRDFFAYVDEFQNFATESFAVILSEARKYRLSLVLANQYLAQMDDDTREAVFGNVGSLLAFQVGASDAELLAEQLGGDVVASDLMNLPKHTAYVRMLIDGQPGRPFSMRTLAPPVRAGDLANPAVLRRTSQHRYGRQRRPEPRTTVGSTVDD